VSPSALAQADLPAAIPTCPAAEALEGPPTAGPSVVCRAMVRDEEQTDQIVHGESASPLVTARRDPSTLYGFCCGKAIPRSTADDVEARASYTFCPVWELEKKRIEERKEMMKDPKRRGRSEAAEAVLSGAVRDIEKGDALQEWLDEPEDDD
jgi:hypothetical protein